MRPSDVEADAASASPPADEPLYPLEGKFTSVKDREEILALPEIEREEILAERAHEVTRKKQDMQLKRALATTKALGSKAKRKAEEDHEDGARRTTRPKTNEKTGKSALDEYKRAREQKGQGPRRGDIDSSQPRRQDSRSPSRGSDRDAEGESEVEWAEPSHETRRDEPPPALRDFERTRIGRSNFSKVCFNPVFDATVKGCFCRVNVSVNKSTGQNEYRMAQIKGFTEGKPYYLEASNGKSFLVDRYAVMSQGSAEKPYPFLACSDSRITPEEFARYESTLTRENKKLPSLKFLHSKVQDIQNMLDHRWTDADIQKRLDTMATLEKKYAKPTRGELMKRKATAEERGDFDEVAKLDAQLAVTENAAKAAAQKPSPPKPKGVIDQDRMAIFNRNTREKNSENVRRAILAERKKQEEWVEAYKKKKREEAAAEQLKREEELFGGGGSSANGSAAASKKGSMPDVVVKKKRDTKGLPLGSLRGKATTDDDVLGDLDLGLEIDI